MIVYKNSSSCVRISSNSFIKECSFRILNDRISDFLFSMNCFVCFSYWSFSKSIQRFCNSLCDSFLYFFDSIVSTSNRLISCFGYSLSLELTMSNHFLMLLTSKSKSILRWENFCYALMLKIFLCYLYKIIRNELPSMKCKNNYTLSPKNYLSYTLLRIPYGVCMNFIS